MFSNTTISVGSSSNNAREFPLLLTTTTFVVMAGGVVEVGFDREGRLPIIAIGTEIPPAMQISYEDCNV